MLDNSILTKSMSLVARSCGPLAAALVTYGALEYEAQAASKGSVYVYSYDYAVSCAGLFHSLQRPASDVQSHNALWRYTQAAGELARRQGLRPATADRAIAKAARSYKGLNSKHRFRRSESCLMKLASKAP